MRQPKAVDAMRPSRMVACHAKRLMSANGEHVTTQRQRSHASFQTTHARLMRAFGTCIFACDLRAQALVCRRLGNYIEGVHDSCACQIARRARLLPMDSSKSAPIVRSTRLSNMMRSVYFVLVLVRICFALSPSYIHPDEHFQGPEIITGI